MKDIDAYFKEAVTIDDFYESVVNNDVKKFDIVLGEFIKIKSDQSKNSIQEYAIIENNMRKILYISIIFNKINIFDYLIKLNNEFNYIDDMFYLINSIIINFENKIGDKTFFLDRIRINTTDNNLFINNIKKYIIYNIKYILNSNYIEYIIDYIINNNLISIVELMNLLLDFYKEIDNKYIYNKIIDILRFLQINNIRKNTIILG